MSYAQVLSFEEFREAQEKEAFRARLQGVFAEWLEQVEGAVEEQGKTLEDLTGALFALRGELTGKVAEAFVERLHASALDQLEAVCPECGAVLWARGSHSRTVETLVGEVRITRPYFYCVRCRKGFHPLDAALELSERRKQWDIQKAVSSSAAEMPYETASALFEELTGLSASDYTLHEIVGEVTEGLTVLDMSPSLEEIRQRVAKVAQGKKWRPILVLAVDGAHVPTRPEAAKGKRRGRKRHRAKRARWRGEWREAKGFRFYLVSEDRIEHLLSWHQVQSDEALAEALRQVKEAGLIPEAEVRLCVLADGAKWIWKVVRRLFPSAVEVLDYYHCSEHLHRVAQAQYGGFPERAREWIEATLARLFCNEVEGVLEGLERMQPKDEEARQEIEALLRYLRGNQDRLDYGFARKGGYPLGSGGIESSNKLICHVRLKRSGAWWYVEKANEMLALRCAKYNGTFAHLFRRAQERARLAKASVKIT